MDKLPPVPIFPKPESRSKWERQRLEVRQKLFDLLGDMPFPKSTVATYSVVEEADYFREEIQFKNGVGDPVNGVILRPKTDQKCPAVLYCHWHGDEYELGKAELFRKTFSRDGPGPELVRHGYIVFCIDAYCFGSRRGHGPCGPNEQGRSEELSAAKFNLWAGRTFWGMILRDDLMALDYLCSCPRVDVNRIGVMGISMGATRTWWLMALDERLRVGMAGCCLTRYQDLIAAGALNQHGIYYYVPNMLKYFDTEAVISLIAPRPILFQNGDQDAGSPIEGIRKVEKIAPEFWRIMDNEKGFESHVYAGLSHEFTPAMWRRTLGWFDRHLLDAS